jgi:hypothetical protein
MHNTIAQSAAVVIFVLYSVAFLAPFLAPFSPYDQQDFLVTAYKPPFTRLQALELKQPKIQRLPVQTANNTAEKLSNSLINDLRTLKTRNEPHALKFIDEYRIGFSIGSDPTVVYGTVWPLYEQESGEDLPMMIPGGAGLLEGLPASPLQQILATLRECGIVQIKHHSERFTMEFCDDCGAPLFPDREGELVHAEMPEDTPPPVEHFH